MNSVNSIQGVLSSPLLKKNFDLSDAFFASINNFDSLSVPDFRAINEKNFSHRDTPDKSSLQQNPKDVRPSFEKKHQNNKQNNERLYDDPLNSEIPEKYQTIASKLPKNTHDIQREQAIEMSAHPFFSSLLTMTISTEVNNPSSVQDNTSLSDQRIPASVQNQNIPLLESPILVASDSVHTHSSHEAPLQEVTNLASPDIHPFNTRDTAMDSTLLPPALMKLIKMQHISQGSRGPQEFQEQYPSLTLSSGLHEEGSLSTEQTRLQTLANQTIPMAESHLPMNPAKSSSFVGMNSVHVPEITDQSVLTAQQKAQFSSPHHLTNNSFTQSTMTEAEPDIQPNASSSTDSFIPTKHLSDKNPSLSLVKETFSQSQSNSIASNVDPEKSLANGGKGTQSPQPNNDSGINLKSNTGQNTASVFVTLSTPSQPPIHPSKNFSAPTVGLNALPQAQDSSFFSNNSSNNSFKNQSTFLESIQKENFFGKNPSGSAIFNQVKVHIARHLHPRESNEIKIKLKPEHLGEVNIKLNINNVTKDTQILIIVDTLEALEALQKDAKILEKTFEQTGLKLSEKDMQFHLKDHDTDFANSQENTRQQKKNTLPSNPSIIEDISESTMEDHLKEMASKRGGLYIKA